MSDLWLDRLFGPHDLTIHQPLDAFEHWKLMFEHKESSARLDLAMKLVLDTDSIRITDRLCICGQTVTN